MASIRIRSSEVLPPHAPDPLNHWTRECKDFSGVFNKDNDVAHFNFTVGSQSTITIFSSSWDDGGFDPILAIWAAGTGGLIFEQDDGENIGSTLSNGVLYDHGVWDTYYSVSLAAGNYTATVAQFNNFAVGGNLADGFRWDADPHFTFTLGYGSQPNLTVSFKASAAMIQGPAITPSTS